MSLDIFDARLDRASSHPVAVAVSGGADSMLALRRTVAWAKAVGRPVIALSVDHQIQNGSAAWSAFAAGEAERLAVSAKVLVWEGEKPATGLAAAARAARHRLLADAARTCGAKVIVTGHTASDGRENALLGQGALREWSPSPVWPQGRGLFLLRPLLAMTRGEVREALRAEGGRWIDDPANDDTGRPRVRARLSGEDVAASVVDDGPVAALALEAAFAGEAVRIDRERYAASPQAARLRVLGAALVSAGGGERPPRRASLISLDARLTAGGPVTATLCGARLDAAQTIAVTRNLGEFKRRTRSRLSLRASDEAVLDGRYGLTEGTPKGFCPILAEPGGQWLVPERFRGACGLIAHETSL